MASPAWEEFKTLIALQKAPPNVMFTAILIIIELALAIAGAL